jgi:CRP/FNR family transcriptional regulator
MKYTTRKTESDRFIRGVPFLSCLTDDELHELKEHIIERRFLKNQIILQEEDTSNYLYLVYSGKVKVVQLSADGKEKIIAIHKRGDFFGEMAVIDGRTAPATVIAMEETKVGFIARQFFESYVLNNKEVLKNIIAMLCVRLRQAWLMLKVMSFAGAEERVRIVLKNMGEQFGIQDQRGIIVNMRLTHRDIAEFASVSRETATRIMRAFVRAGEIEILENRLYVLKQQFMDHMDSL